MQISQKIVDYAIWYYLKYYPSIEKLKRKLFEKFWVESENGKKYWGIGDEEVEYIFSKRMHAIIDESWVIQWKIRWMRRRWKSKFYIKSNLYKKLFNKDILQEHLEKEFSTWEDENILNILQKVLRREWVALDNFEEKEYIFKQKIFQKVMNKWFRYDDVKRVLTDQL